MVMFFLDRLVHKIRETFLHHGAPFVDVCISEALDFVLTVILSIVPVNPLVRHLHLGYRGSLPEPELTPILI